MTRMIDAYKCVKCQTTHNQTDPEYWTDIMDQSKEGLFKVEDPRPEVQYFVSYRKSTGHLHTTAPIPTRENAERLIRWLAEEGIAGTLNEVRP